MRRIVTVTDEPPGESREKSPETSLSLSSVVRAVRASQQKSPAAPGFMEGRRDQA
jgi:hypothetical protein